MFHFGDPILDLGLFVNGSTKIMPGCKITWLLLKLTSQIWILFWLFVDCEKRYLKYYRKKKKEKRLLLNQSNPCLRSENIKRKLQAKDGFRAREKIYNVNYVWSYLK